MATLFSLAIVSSIVLISLYLAYKLLLAPLKQPVINRVTIILIYIISIAAWPVSQWIAQSRQTAATSANAVPGISIDALTAEFITSPETANRLADTLLLIYYIGLALVALITIIGVTKLIVSLRRSPLIDVEGSRVRLMDNTNAAPFSFFGMMAMGRNDLDDARLIVAHERCHQRRHHSIDLLLAQLVAIFQWFNPAAWLMMRELKAVHEFDVDEQLISAGINLKEYQYLLIKKAVGARFPSLANSLNHSNLKNRITMMQKSNDAKSRRWRALALAPALILALSVTHLSSVASVIEAAASSRMPGVSDGKVTENNPVEQAVDYSQQSPSQGETLVVTTTETIHAANSTADEQEAQKVRYTAETLPQFPGGEKALLGWVADHMQYPQEAIDRNEHGRVIVKFIINEKGQVIEPEIVRSVSPSLDAEALRVVGTLPDFEPGKVNGKAVSVSYVLPVNFSLKADTASPQQAEAIIKDGNVTVFVNGEANEYSVLNDINPVDIESMQIIKNDPDYPQGKIIITLKQ